MSSALVRQALSFVDPEETKVKRNKRRVDTNRPQSIGQASSHPYKNNSNKQNKSAALPKKDQDLVDENVKKFLALSTPFANKAVTEKIVKRAIKGKPLLEEKIEVKDTEEKSILFPEDNIPKKKTKRHNKK